MKMLKKFSKKFTSTKEVKDPNAKDATASDTTPDMHAEEMADETRDGAELALQKVALPEGSLGVSFRGGPRPVITKISESSPLLGKVQVGQRVEQLLLPEEELSGMPANELANKLKEHASTDARVLVLSDAPLETPVEEVQEETPEEDEAEEEAAENEEAAEEPEPEEENEEEEAEDNAEPEEPVTEDQGPKEEEHIKEEEENDVQDDEGDKEEEEAEPEEAPEEDKENEAPKVMPQEKVKAEEKAPAKEVPSQREMEVADDALEASAASSSYACCGVF